MTRRLVGRGRATVASVLTSSGFSSASCETVHFLRSQSCVTSKSSGSPPTAAAFGVLQQGQPLAPSAGMRVKTAVIACGFEWRLEVYLNGQTEPNKANFSARVWLLSSEATTPAIRLTLLMLANTASLQRT